MSEVVNIKRKPMAIVAEIKSSLRYMSQEMAGGSSTLPQARRWSRGVGQGKRIVSCCEALTETAGEIYVFAALRAEESWEM